MPPTIEENNRRIAKNTLFMYLRMGVTLIVSLFTTRVVLDALGVSDYGLYNVVGGFVGMLGFFNGLLSQGSTRFITMGLGQGYMEELKRTFSACVTIHIAIAAITLLLGESIGLWFVNHKMVFEPGREQAANLVFQFSLITAVVGILQTPYMACITAHEKMNVLAYGSIADVVLKLAIVYLLLTFNGDKLILYATFYLCVSLIMSLFWTIYCLRKFPECSLRASYDPKLYRDIFNYVGWNSIGALAFMANGQGVNILLNMFFGTIVNAARGVAGTVCNYINQFVSGFQNAINPQTIKYCAQGNFEQMNRLVLNNAKYSSFLILFVGIPAFLEIEFVLNLWLHEVPEYTIAFVRISIIQLYIQAIDFPIGSGIHAYGEMKLANITSGIVYLSIFPIAYFLLKAGLTPIYIYLVFIVVYPIALIFDLWILNKYTGFDLKEFAKDVVLRSLLSIFLSSIIPSFIHFTMKAGALRFLAVGCASVLFSAITIYILGLSKSMRERIIRVVENRLKIKLDFLSR